MCAWLLYYAHLYPMERTMERKDWTIKVYKFDKRCKTGEKFIGRYEYCDKTHDNMVDELRDLRYKLYPRDKFDLELYETWVTRTNLMTGKEFKEHFETPTYCSPAFEAYWSK